MEKPYVFYRFRSGDCHIRQIHRFLAFGILFLEDAVGGVLKLGEDLYSAGCKMALLLFGWIASWFNCR